MVLSIRSYFSNGGQCMAVIYTCISEKASSKDHCSQVGLIWSWLSSLRDKILMVKKANLQIYKFKRKPKTVQWLNNCNCIKFWTFEEIYNNFFVTEAILDAGVGYWIYILYFWKRTTHTQGGYHQFYYIHQHVIKWHRRFLHNFCRNTT